MTERNSKRKRVRGEILPVHELVIRITAYTQPSLKHPGYNEDALAFSQEEGWSVLLDGMGGLGNGQEASNLAKDVIVRHISSIVDSADPIAVQQAMIRVFGIASENVRDRIYEGGTTAVAVKIVGVDTKRAIVASVGDSRVYLLRDGMLFRITDDHKEYSKRIVDKLDEVSSRRRLTRVEKEAFRNRNIITQYLGQASPLSVNAYWFEVKEGDKIILTSDGVHDNLTHDEIAQEVSVGGADNLVERALERSQEPHFRAKKDDITAIVIEFGAEGRRGLTDESPDDTMSLMTKMDERVEIAQKSEEDKPLPLFPIDKLVKLSNWLQSYDSTESATEELTADLDYVVGLIDRLKTIEQELTERAEEYKADFTQKQLASFVASVPRLSRASGLVRSSIMLERHLRLPL